MKLFRSLFGGTRKASKPESDPGKPQPETVVAVVGDVHGRADLLTALMDRIDAETDAAHIITVGDYVDRGEESRQVLEDLMARNTSAPDRVICLMGNHEKMLLDFLDRPTERGQRWLRNGGLQTLASFGVGGVTETSGDAALLSARDAFQAALPQGLEDWMRGLPLTWQSGNLWVVHAAADPALPMEMQQDRVLLWGHSAFLGESRQDGLWVAHGHTVMDGPVMGQSRISVDTGAYATGRLTAAIVRPEGAVSFLSTAE